MAVLKAGEDLIIVTWSYNNTFPAGTDSTYKTVKVKLCYAPISKWIGLGERQWKIWRRTRLANSILLLSHTMLLTTHSHIQWRGIFPLLNILWEPMPLTLLVKRWPMAKPQMPTRLPTSLIFKELLAAIRRLILPPSVFPLSLWCPCLDSSSWRRERPKHPSKSEKWVGENYSGFSFLSWANGLDC